MNVRWFTINGCQTLRAVLAAAGIVILAGTDFLLAQPTGPQIDFARDIRPILKQHCLPCHSARAAEGGLSLETRKDAEFGGDSQEPILSSDLTASELYRRITSDDETTRMPKGRPALSAAEQERIAVWLQSGADWPDDVAVRESDEEGTVPGDTVPPNDSWLDRIEQINRRLDRIPGRMAFQISLLAVVLIILLLERRRKTTSSAGRPSVSRAWYLVLVLTWLTSLTVTIYHSSLTAAERELVQLRQAAAELASLKRQQSGLPDYRDIFGDPPRPFRPDHPAALEHTYYRGNCERNDRLFNGGNYRTAEMTIQLCDADGTPVDYGDPVLDRPLFIRFELKRSRMSTPNLFSSGIIQAVFLTNSWIPPGASVESHNLYRLKVVQEGDLWECRVPLTPPSDDGTQRGYVYVFKGRIRDGKMSAVPHYAIRYNLQIDNNGTLDADSEIWMNAIYFPHPVHPPPPPGKLPFSEWFSHEPIPEITGKNTTDPDLLGLPEHLGPNAGRGESPGGDEETSQPASSPENADAPEADTSPDPSPPAP